jgi:hypothetical protein
MGAWKRTNEIYQAADEDMQAIITAERRDLARQRLDASDVLALTQDLLLTISTDHDHPLWPLIQHCTNHGTLLETGRIPPMAECLGLGLLPYIELAIARLVGETIGDVSAWD